MERYDETNKASILGIVGNIFLLLIKGLVGIFTHSQAMIADATNSASDILNSFMTYIGNKVSSQEPDDDHNLGHGKAEYIYSLLISITMIVLAIKTFIDSIESLFVKNNYSFSWWLIIVCLTTICVKFFLYLYTRKISIKYNNLLVKANSNDHRNDCIITSFNLLSVVLAYNNIYFFDGLVGIGIAGWIFYTGIIIFKESYDVLMDKTMDEEVKNKVLEIIKDHDEVYKINHFNATPVGFKYQISFTIFVDGNLSTFDSHKIANSLEKEIDKKVPEVFLTVIHVNPMKVKDKE